MNEIFKVTPEDIAMSYFSGSEMQRFQNEGLTCLADIL